MTLISHHLLLCAAPTKALCCPDPELGAASWARLKQLVRELGLEDAARPQGIVLRTKADCLRICAEGPIPGPIRSLSWSLSTAADICAGVRGNCLSPRWSRHSRSLLLQPI